MNRRHLYLDSTIIRGRRLRASMPDGGGGTPGSGADNAGAGQGNLGGDSGTPGSESNNDGDAFDPTSFWDSPAPTPSPTPSGESAGSGSPGSGTDEPNFAQTLTQQMTTMTFGEPVFTSEIAEEMSQGNFANVEKRIQTQMQAAVRNALAMNVQVLRPFAEQLMTQMRNEFGSTLSQRDDQSTLITDFPSASNPVIAPIIKGIYEQALIRTNGDRPLAVKQTKQMLQHMASQTAGDLQLEIAPQGAGDSRPSQPAINWLDELTGRS